MGWTEKDLLYTVNRLCEEGVPPGVIARVFDLDEDLVKRQQKTVRLERYGTSDMEEYLEQAQWDAIDWARGVIANGSPAEQARASSFVLSKAISASGRRVPDSVKNERDRILSEMESMKTGAAEAPRERSRFVAIAGGAEDE